MYVSFYYIHRTAHIDVYLINTGFGDFNAAEIPTSMALVEPPTLSCVMVVWLLAWLGAVCVGGMPGCVGI